MNDKTLTEKAGELARRNYTFRAEVNSVLRHGRGDNPKYISTFVFFGRVVELPECVAQADTWEKLKYEIRGAIKNYIYSLLVDGLDVPDPMPESFGVGSSSATLGTVRMSEVFSGVDLISLPEAS